MTRAELFVQPIIRAVQEIRLKTGECADVTLHLPTKAFDALAAELETRQSADSFFVSGVEVRRAVSK